MRLLFVVEACLLAQELWGAPPVRVAVELRGKKIYLCMRKQRVQKYFEAVVAEYCLLRLCLAGALGALNDVGE